MNGAPGRFLAHALGELSLRHSQGNATLANGARERANRGGNEGHDHQGAPLRYDATRIGHQITEQKQRKMDTAVMNRAHRFQNRWDARPTGQGANGLPPLYNMT